MQNERDLAKQFEEWRRATGAWLVTTFDLNGGADAAMFIGPNAEQQARDYAMPKRKRRTPSHHAV